MSTRIPRAQKKACDVCYEKKIHCSIPDPEGPCEWCENRGLECTFDRERPRKRKRDSVNPSDVQNLFERVEQLEKALLQIQSTQNTPSLNTPGAESARPSLQSELNSPQARTSSVALEGDESTRLARTVTIPTFNSSDIFSHRSTRLVSQLGPNWLFSGIPLSSEAGYQWLATRTGQKITGTEFSIPIRTIRVSTDQETGFLPDKSSVQEIVRSFFGPMFRSLLPVLDEDLIEETLETAYEPTGSLPLSNAQISANACILSALALSPSFCPMEENVLVADVDLFASKANYLLNQVAGYTSLTLLQTALMLELRCVYDGHWLGAVPFHSIACRIVCSLAGHPSRFSTTGCSNSEREHRHIQQLFWVCYILDKDLSLRTGSPPLLPDACGDPISRETPWDRLPDNADLAIVKQNVCKLLFSARALRGNDNKLLSSIRQLDDEMECWRLSIRAILRPALYVSENAVMEIFARPDMRRIALQLDYNHLMTVIHTTVRRCTTETGDGTDNLHHVVHSSFDLSLVASRSTLWCLKFLTGTSRRTKEASRATTLYSTTAAMALFLDIVIHPYSEQAQLDLELLNSTAHSIQSLCKTDLRLTPSEIDRFRETSNFVMRLVWFGSCAIAKAEK